MRVLVACEFSGIVREAFAARGHDAWSCDLLPSEQPGNHYQGDVLQLLNGCICEYAPDGGGGNVPPEDVRWEPPVGCARHGYKHWDLMIAHPPCTYLTLAGLHWNYRIPGRKGKTEEALEFVRLLLDAPVPLIALENPVGCISTNIRKPDQKIQPWQFGHDASKLTCLWLKGLPQLQHTKVLEPPALQTNGKSPRWSNQTPTGQNKLGPSADRWKLRSVTYQGIAAAMAEQWGNL